MALVVNTNVASIQAQYNVSKTNQSMQDAMAALSSGKRINSAGDDAAGLSISTRMEAQVRGLSQAIRNANDGISLVDTAEGAMDEITNMLQRMRELAVQASNGTLNSQDRENINAEFGQLKTEIDRVVNNTRFNDQVMLDGSFAGSLQVGAKSSESFGISVGNLSTSALGSTTNSTSVGAVSAGANGSEAVENVVNLTFNGNDTYGFKITLDGKTGAGAGNEEITISGGTVSGFSAQAIADKINAAVAANDTTTPAGADLSSILKATANGATVTLTNKAGSKIDITSFTSSGAGTMTVNPVTNSSASSKTLENTQELTSLANTGGTRATASTAALQLEVGKKFQFRVNDTLISVDTTDSAGAALAGANLTAAIAGVVADVKAAIEAGSGAGTATVTSATDAGSTNFTLSIADSTGEEIEVSGFQKLTSSKVEDGFLTIDLDVSDNTSTVYTVDHDKFISTGDGSATGQGTLDIAANKTGRIQFSNQDLKYTFEIAFSGGNQSYTIDGATKNFQDEIARVAEAISADGGSSISASNVGGVLEIVNNSAATLSIADNAKLAAPGIDAIGEGNAYFLADSLADANTDTDNLISNESGVVTLVDGTIVRSSDGVKAETSQMALSFSANDRFTFKIDKDGSGTDADATITADVVNGSLTSVMNVVNSHSSTTGVSAKIDGGQLLLEKADGTAFSIHGFVSEGGAQIAAANAAAQGGSAVLQNAGDGATASIAASGKAVETEATLSFTQIDSAVGAEPNKVSFKISDGNSVAVVRATEVLDADSDGAAEVTADVADLKAEIESALSAANMSGHITVTESSGVLTLKNSLGGKIEISDFKTDTTMQATFAPKVGQGVGKILNDDANAGSATAVASTDTLTISGSQVAIDAIDRALENVNDERSKLGAVSNRLNYSVSNLGNVVVNTEASRSRIEDADFAAESAKLAKNQILLQAGTAMLAQANASQQTVLSLLG